MQANELAAYLDELLQVDLCARADRSLNGLQVGRSRRPIAKVALAVDASAETIRRAAGAGADLLLVHHGLFWGSPIAITGTHYERVKLFLDNDIALYACHLPLDRHETLGNNAVMARMLGLRDTMLFGEYHGIEIGWKGRLPEPATTHQICERLFGSTDDVLGILPFGPESCTGVGIISGGAPDDVTQAIDEGLDLYITGDASHTIYHRCLEAGINVIFGGHYATETHGVRAVGERLTAEFSLDTEFIDVPTGL